MNDPTLTPDDPRLTAYALGELSGDERAHVEAALRDDPLLRAAVEEIRITAGQLEAALAAEAREEIDAAPATNGHAFGETDQETELAHGVGMARVIGERDSRNLDGGYRSPSGGGKILRFPQLYVIVATAAAACVALFMHLSREENATRQQAAETMARIAHAKRAIEARQNAKTIAVLISAPPETDGAANSRIADTPSPPLETRLPSPMPAGAERATVVADTGPTATPATGSAPVENKLALLEIAKLDPATAPNTLAIPRPLIFGPAGASPLGNIAVTTVLSTRAVPSTLSPPPAIGPAADGRAGTTSSAVVALSDPVSISTFTVPAQPGDDIVKLDAFEVSADRLTGSLFGSSLFSNFETITRGMAEHEPLPRPPPGALFGRAKERDGQDNDFVRTAENPTSRFPVDIGTASYASVRRLIEQGMAPSREMVRVEELINYFPYDYAAPKNDQPFAASIEVASAPWAPGHRLVRVGLKAGEISKAQRAPANLVFLIDVSASMSANNKLPLVRDTLRKLIDKLRPDDRVAIVTYASTPVVALPSTSVARASEILAALNALKPGGAADGASGLALAYRQAIANFSNGVNHVLLCTDEGFNTGITSERELLALIDEKTKTGIALTLLGFGPANAQSPPLERLARRSGALYGYIDSPREAEKRIVEQIGNSLALIARDVRMEVEFNPLKVLAYRLIGYENRPLRREDYSEEAGAAGEIGAGQTVTALYEIMPAPPPNTVAAKAKADYTKYGAEGLYSSRFEMPETRKQSADELLTVRVRHKAPNALIGFTRTQEFAATDSGAQFANASADFRFAAAVAEFGMILRGSPYKGSGTMGDVSAWANAAVNTRNDPRNYRRDFIEMVRKASGLVRPGR